jgi:hypothetical protein
MLLLGRQIRNATLPDRRDGRRLRVLQQAKIVFGPATMIHCYVRDLSAGGAMIDLGQIVELPATFEIFIAGHNLRNFSARLRWTKGRYAGVSFGT